MWNHKSTVYDLFLEVQLLSCFGSCGGDEMLVSSRDHCERLKRFTGEHVKRLLNVLNCLRFLINFER